jgi:threonine dehydrogenase-like Zn-dependent dehydrogenase
MKGLFVTAPEKLELLEIPIPEPGPYEALVKTEACAICNSTDTKIIHGKFVSGTWPVLLGHEAVGKIVKQGAKVKSFHIGDRVLRGTLPDSQVPFAGGRSCWGGFVEYNLVTDVWSQEGKDYQTWPHPQQIVPASIDPIHATALITLKENLSVVTRFDVVGKTLAIVGTGPVAQAMALFARILGANEIVVFGRHSTWEDRFVKFGVDGLVSGDQVPAKIQHILDHGGFDRVLEAVGSREALSRCIELAGTRGKVGVYGIPPEDNPYRNSDLANPIVTTAAVAEAEVHGRLLEMVQKGQIDLSDWVSLSLPWIDYQEGFNQVWDRKANKVVLTF